MSGFAGYARNATTRIIIENRRAMLRILLWNHPPHPKLCNGTKACSKKLICKVVEATILTGPSKNEDIFIPHISMISTASINIKYFGLKSLYSISI